MPYLPRDKRGCRDIPGIKPQQAENPQEIKSMTGHDIDIVHILSQAGLMVQFVLLLLLFFSVMSWAIIIIKFR